MYTTRNFTNIYTSEEIQHYLSQLQHQSTMTFIPALVYLCLLIVVGSVGNCLVLVIYCYKMTRTPLRIFIISMAIFDLPTNLLVIPGEIYDMFHVWDFNRPNICRVRRYLNAAIIISSVLVLVAIATTRYRMVCLPSGEQVTISQAKLTSCLIVVFSCIFALPYGMIHGTQTIKTPNPTILGRHCGIDDSYLKSIWPNLNSAFFICIFVSCCLSMIVFYTCIGHKTWKHSQTRKQLVRGGNVSALKKISVTKSPKLNRRNAAGLQRFEAFRKLSDLGQHIKTEFVDLINKDKSEMIPIQPLSNVVDLTNKDNSETIPIRPLSNFVDVISKDKSETMPIQPLSNTPRKVSGHRSGIRSLEMFDFTPLDDEMQNSFRIETVKVRGTFFTKTTWLMFTVSLVFVLGFVPFLALNFYKTAFPERYAALQGVSLAFYHLFLRSHYINSAINPILYSLIDRNFQNTCSQLIHGGL